MTCKSGHVPQRTSREAHRAAHIHWIPQHVERESLYSVVHEDTEVVAKERPGDP